MKILITGGVGFIGTNTAIFFAKNKKIQLQLLIISAEKKLIRMLYLLKKLSSNKNHQNKRC